MPALLHRLRHVTTSALLSGVAFLAACGGTQASKPSSTTAAPSGQENAAEDGYRAVLAAKTIDGHALAQEVRPTAFVFFASWCGHCQRELAILGELREQYPELRIIGLNAYEEFRDFSDQERLRAYVAESAPWLTEIVTADETMRGVFGGVPKIPSLFLYDAEGAVKHEFRRKGGPPPSRDVLEAAIRSLVR